MTSDLFIGPQQAFLPLCGWPCITNWSRFHCITTLDEECRLELISSSKFWYCFPFNLSSCITLPVSFHTGWRCSGPLQRRRVALFLHCNWLPDAEREAVIRGGVQPGEGCQALDSPQPRILPAAAELHTLRLLLFFLTSRQSPVDCFPSAAGGNSRKYSCGHWACTEGISCFDSYSCLLMLMRSLREEESKVRGFKTKIMSQKLV